MTTRLGFYGGGCECAGTGDGERGEGDNESSGVDTLGLDFILQSL